MKKEIWCKVLYAISILLAVGFVIRLGVDYFMYDKVANSAPFYAYVIVRALEFILPSAIVFIVARLLKKKTSQKNADLNI